MFRRYGVPAQLVEGISFLAMKCFSAGSNHIMFLNEHTAISTSKVLLVPYSKHHVPQYHKWMQDPAMQEATASEPLTITQEYAMQESWRKDADKLTFIICQPLSIPEDQQPLSHGIQSEIQDTADYMIGDVNLFLSPSSNPDTISNPHDSQDKDFRPPANPPNNSSDTDASPPTTVTGELELMIADAPSQRKGYGRAALLTFIHYIRTYQSEIVGEFLGSRGSPNHASMTTTATSSSSSSTKSRHPTPPTGRSSGRLSLTAKISTSNTPSLALFSSLGFIKTAEEPNFFGEYQVSLPHPKDSDSVSDLVSGPEAGVGRMVENCGIERYRELVYVEMGERR